jgi:hypothetical protein
MKTIEGLVEQDNPGMEEWDGVRPAWKTWVEERYETMCKDTLELLLDEEARQHSVAGDFDYFNEEK